MCHHPGWTMNRICNAVQSYLAMQKITCSLQPPGCPGLYNFIAQVCFSEANQVFVAAQPCSACANLREREVVWVAKPRCSLVHTYTRRGNSSRLTTPIIQVESPHQLASRRLAARVISPGENCLAGKSIQMQLALRRRLLQWAPTHLVRPGRRQSHPIYGAIDSFREAHNNPPSPILVLSAILGLDRAITGEIFLREKVPNLEGGRKS